MKLFKNSLVAVLVMVAMVLTIGLAFAAPEARGGDDGRGDRDRGHRGLGGEVTTIGENSITLVNRRDEEVVVTVTDETEIFFSETNSAGSLNDLELGDKVRVKGQRNEDGTVTAEKIGVAPRGDQVGGKVTAVDGNVITVENRDGFTISIVTSDETQFRLGKDETGSLADVAVDKFVKAFGETQDDSSLSANLVMVSDGKHKGGKPGPRPNDAQQDGE